ncbi:hypothetical protein BT69DRAFT_1278024 [Atractiella rhizophila]|nr:hypothetical protein BT69DRAFT_1278024 [Atractiella rhizophila]
MISRRLRKSVWLRRTLPFAVGKSCNLSLCKSATKASSSSAPSPQTPRWWQQRPAPPAPQLSFSLRLSLFLGRQTGLADLPWLSSTPRSCSLRP